MYNRVQSHDTEHLSSTASCTNKWLSAICFLTFLQAIVVVGIAATGAMVYHDHESDIAAWQNLNWKGMANTLHSTYTEVDKHPIGATLNNVHSASVKLDNIPYDEIREMSHELIKHKKALGKIDIILGELIPSLQEINSLLHDDMVIDLKGILNKVNVVVRSPVTADAVHQAREILSEHNVDVIVNSVKQIGSAVEIGLTPENINRTLHALEDFDKSLHRAESTVGKIGLILGKT